MQIDLQASRKVMPPLAGVKLTGTNININNVKIRGNEFCGAGLLVLGCKSRVVNTFVSGFAMFRGCRCRDGLVMAFMLIAVIPGLKKAILRVTNIT